MRIDRPALGSDAPLGIELRLEVDGLREPLFVTHAGDGTGDLYVVERPGTIRVARAGAVRARAFLDISDRVGASGSEQGLLGLAFHPRYVENGHLYVNYTDRQGDTIVARYTAAGDRTAADAGSEAMVLRLEQPFPNHNGGHLVFGPDGMLWIGTGDGGAGGDPFDHAQNPTTLLGKMLRIDVDAGLPYAIPTGNATFSAAGSRGEIWALGLRNPWRYSFDRATGDLFIADVGQHAWEEVNFTPAPSPPGLNYGWNRMEGTHCYPEGARCDAAGFVLPVAEYANGPAGCSATGGYVYRGRAYPRLRGTYLFTDFCTGTIWGLNRDERGSWQPSVLRPPPGGFAGFSSFGEDEAGELYLTALERGVVYRVVLSGPE